MEDLMLRLELQAFFDRYIHVIDSDQLKEWPKLFTEDCLYEMIPKENEEAGLPAPVMYCDNNRMLRDRILSLQHTNVFEKPSYRQFLSALQVTKIEEDVYDISVNYVVVNTSLAGESSVIRLAAMRIGLCELRKVLIVSRGVV